MSENETKLSSTATVSSTVLPSTVQTTMISSSLTSSSTSSSTSSLTSSELLYNLFGSSDLSPSEGSLATSDVAEEKKGNSIGEKKEKSEIKVITFNMLSQDAATPDYFPKVKKHYLEFENRSKKMKQLLTSWMIGKDGKGKGGNYIICLQEFSEQWMNELGHFFEGNNYKLFHKTYANGRMGVAIAYPDSLYDILGLDTTTIGSEITRVHAMFKDNYQPVPSGDKFVDSSKAAKIPVVLRELENAEKSINVLLSVILRLKSSVDPSDGPSIKSNGKTLIVSTYHMPCKFTQKYYMIAQINAFKTYLDRLVSSTERKYPGSSVNLIATGDFNVSSTNPEYKLLTGIPYTEEELKNPVYESIATMKDIYGAIGMKLDQGVKLKSAFYSLNGREPNYTNVSIKNGATFTGCLDYILIDKHIGIVSCTVGLTTDDPVKYCYPNGLSPSDHVPVSASLSI